MGTPDERLVTDLPIWTDCPCKVPRGLEVRRGRFTDGEPEMIAIWHPRSQKHVDLMAENISPETIRVGFDALKRFINGGSAYNYRSDTP